MHPCWIKLFISDELLKAQKHGYLLYNLHLMKMISLYHSVHQTSMPAAVEVRQDDTDFLKHQWRSGTLDFLDIQSSSFRLHRASLGQDLICREKTIMITHPEPRKCGVSHNQKTHWTTFAPILNVSILRSDHPKTDITVQKKYIWTLSWLNHYNS